MEPDGLQPFIDGVGLVVTSTADEHEITKRVAKGLSDLLTGGFRLDPKLVPVETLDGRNRFELAPGEEPPRRRGVRGHYPV